MYINIHILLREFKQTRFGITIFYQQLFPRTCAKHDAEGCEKAFEALGFDVRTFDDRTTDQYTEILSQGQFTKVLM